MPRTPIVSLVLASLIPGLGCGGGGGGHAEPPCDVTGECLDVDGTYKVTAGTSRLTDSNDTDRTSVLDGWTLAIDQIGPAAAFSGVVARVTVDGYVFQGESTRWDGWTARFYTFTFGGEGDTTRAHLTLDGAYEDDDGYTWSWDYTIDSMEKVHE